MNENVPVEAANAAAKVDYPVVKTAVQGNCTTWQIAVANSFMTDVMINKILALAGNGGKVTSCTTGVVNADAKADDF